MRRVMLLVLLFGVVAAVSLVPALSGACHNQPTPTNPTTVGPVSVWGVNFPPTFAGDIGVQAGPVFVEGQGAAGPPASGFLTAGTSTTGVMISGSVPGVPSVCVDQ